MALLLIHRATRAGLLLTAVVAVTLLALSCCQQSRQLRWEDKVVVERVWGMNTVETTFGQVRTHGVASGGLEFAPEDEAYAFVTQYPIDMTEATPKDLLEALSAGDSRYTYNIEGGRFFNIYPARSREDPDYVFNRRFDNLNLKGDYAEVLGKVFRAVGYEDPIIFDVPEQPRFRNMSPFVDFVPYQSVPLKRNVELNLKNATVREAVNNVVRQLGPRTHWIFYRNHSALSDGPTEAIGDNGHKTYCLLVGSAPQWQELPLHQLISKLADESDVVSGDALSEMLRRGYSVVPELVKACQETESPHAKWSALRVLAIGGCDDEAVVALFLRESQSADINVAAEAVNALAEHDQHKDEIAPVLAELAANGSSEVIKTIARRALGWLEQGEGNRDYNVKYIGTGCGPTGE